MFRAMKVVNIGSLIRGNSQPNQLFSFFRQQFSSLSSPTPHSPDYLSTHIEILGKSNIKATITLLKAGTSLVGLNTHLADDLILHATPLYTSTDLPKFSAKEESWITELAKRYFARVGDFKVIQDIKCVTTWTELGYPVYLVHPHMVTMSKLLGNVTNLLKSTEPVVGSVEGIIPSSAFHPSGH